MSDTMSLPTHEINLHNYSSTSKVAELQSIYLKKRGGRKKNENDERSKPKFQQSQPAIKMINSFSLPEIRHLGTKDWTKAYPVKSSEYSHTTLKSKSFGHRPTSAARHLDPMTGKLYQKKMAEKQTQMKRVPGMSAVQLGRFLNAPVEQDDIAPKERMVVNEELYRVPQKSTTPHPFESRVQGAPLVRNPLVLNRPDPSMNIAG